MLNKVQLIGNLGADPDVVTLSSGKLVANVRMATKSWWKAQGERHERTEWHNVRIFGDPLVKMVQKHFKKGGLVFVEGTLNTQESEKDGVTRRFTTVTVGMSSGGVVRLLSSKGSAGEAAGPAADDAENDFGAIADGEEMETTGLEDIA